eukprot:TRINITY_DN20364_c0_g1_i2.p1 TRINITY_DN20364_c0_g1~~TRINITY_DN20364_c0_g1_i2.p1  ORF type:complete len:892 (+),score=200.27 TRINITY_DN20364_c0_g1_i2:26-2677(+)
MTDVTRMSDKGLKIMGLSTEQLVDTFLKDERGALTDDAWPIFWNGLKQKRKAMEVLSRLVDYFLKALNGEYKLKFSIQTLLNTIQFFALWFPIERNNDALSRLLIAWQKDKERMQRENREINGAHQTLQLLQSKMNGTDDVLELLVQWMCKMHPVDRYVWMRQTELLSIDCELFPDGVMSSVYLLLKLMGRDKTVFTKVFNLLVMQVKLIKLNRLFPEEAQDSLLAILHMMRSFLSYWRAPNNVVLKDAIDALQPFFFWPTPYSRITKSVLIRLKQEILGPGTSILERFASDSRVPEINGYPDDVDDGIQKSRPIFYVVDPSNRTTSTWYTILGLRNASPFLEEKADTASPNTGNILSSQVRGLLLLNILNAEVQLSKEEAENVRFMTEEEISDLFERSVIVLQECNEMTYDEAREHRESAFKLVKADFLKFAHANKSKRVDFVRFPANLPEDYMPPVGSIAHLALHDGGDPGYAFPSDLDSEKKGFTPREHRESAFKLVKADFLKFAHANKSKRVDFVRFPANLPEDYMPPVGSIAHLALHDGGDPGYAFPSDLDSEKKGFTPYPKTPVYDKLYNILRSFSQHANEEDPVEIRIVLAGDDGLVHRFVCAYMCIVTEQPDVLIGVVFRIFIVPFQRCAIAGYIARYDAWYHRHVYVPFSESNILLPWMTVMKPVQDPPLEKVILPPVLFLRDSIENYVREALHMLPIRLYKIEAWFGDKKDTLRKVGRENVYTPQIVIPFVQNLEIGLAAEVKSHLRRAAPGPLTGEEERELLDPKFVERLKDFKFQCHELKIDFTKIDLSGKEIEVRNESAPAIPYTRVSLSNFPTKLSPSYPPNPRESGLELSVKVLDRARQRSSRHWSLVDPNQHVVLTLSRYWTDGCFR